MLELIILRLFIRKRDAFAKYFKLVRAASLESATRLLLSTIRDYYLEHPEHEYIAPDEFEAYFKMKYPKYGEKEEFTVLIRRVFQTEVSNDLAEEYVRRLLNKSLAAEVASSLMDVISEESSTDVSEILAELTNKYDEIIAKHTSEDELVHPKDLVSAIEQRAEDGLSWRLGMLQEALGPLVGGSHGHVFARPETGKTSFLHSEVTNFAQQLDKQCILWVNNEEAPNKILIRQHCAMLGIDEYTLLTNPEEYNQEFLRMGGDKIHLITKDTISVDELETWCKQYTPRIVVIDQGDKLTCRDDKKAANGADRLKILYDSIRAMCIRLNNEFRIDIITVGQADAAAEGKRWLYQSNLDSGKTGKPGAFDYIIGIGKEHTPDDTRYISICKNKQQTVAPEKLRGVVTLDRACGRYY